MVELVSDLLLDLGKLVLLKQGQQVPSGIKTLEDSTAIVLTLGQEIVFELLEEDKVVLVICAQSVLTDDSLHSHRVLALSVEGVHLGEDVIVVLTSQFDLVAIFILLNTDGGLHETRE